MLRSHGSVTQKCDEKGCRRRRASGSTKCKHHTAVYVPPDEAEDRSHGRCDTCGAACDAEGCTRDRSHEIANPVAPHSPGPWHYGTGAGTFPAGVGCQSYAPLCKMMGNSPEDAANARLISYAPDMLQTLKFHGGGNVYFEEFGRYCSCGVCTIKDEGAKVYPIAHSTLCDRTNDLIARAEGRPANG